MDYLNNKHYFITKLQRTTHLFLHIYTWKRSLYGHSVEETIQQNLRRETMG